MNKRNIGTIAAAAFAASLNLASPVEAKTICDGVVNRLMELKDNMKEKGFTYRQVRRGKRGRYNFRFYNCIKDEVKKRTDGEYHFFILRDDGKAVLTKKGKDKGKNLYVFRKII